MKNDYSRLSEDYDRIEKAIRFLEENYLNQPSLKEIAESIHLSEFHFQRLFGRWIGITPKRFLQYLTINHAKNVLKKANSLLSVSYDSGLSGTGRLHDLFITHEAMTPGEFRQKGRGLTIYYGVHPTQFGNCVLGITDKGICDLSFVKNGFTDQQVEALKKRWQKALYVYNLEKTYPYIEKIFNTPVTGKPVPLHIYVKGTNFQIKVWDALLKIPAGLMLSYNDVAKFIGNPNASRAVGTAVAKNPVSFIIPCHRVIKRSGLTGNYQGGTIRKKAILAWEAVNFYNK